MLVQKNAIMAFFFWTSIYFITKEGDTNETTRHTAFYINSLLHPLL